MKDSKLEAIKEAYGEFYEICKPNHNGWTFVGFERNQRNHYKNLKFSDESVEVVFKDDWLYDDGILWRPIQLKGIEDNNGWFSVSQYGLPKEKGEIDIIRFENNGISRCHFDPESYHAGYLFTHWRPLDYRLPLHL